MIDYLATVPRREAAVVAGRRDDDSGLLVVGVNNFDSDTFSFPSEPDAPAPYVVITDEQGGVIRFSTLHS